MSKLSKALASYNVQATKVGALNVAYHAQRAYYKGKIAPDERDSYFKLVELYFTDPLLYKLGPFLPKGNVIILDDQLLKDVFENLRNHLMGSQTNRPMSEFIEEDEAIRAVAFRQEQGHDEQMQVVEYTPTGEVKPNVEPPAPTEIIDGKSAF